MRQIIKDTVDEVERVRGVMDYAKAVCTAFGTIGVGSLIAFYAPPDLKQEISVHRELGVGMMTFGGVFVLALFFDRGPGSVGQRAKSLLLALITGAFAIGAAISDVGPNGLVGYGLSLTVGLFSLSALWEVVSGRPRVTADT